MYMYFMLVFFAWLSFFAPQVGSFWSLVFVLIMGCLLLLKIVKKEYPRHWLTDNLGICFWLFFLASLAVAYTRIDSLIARQHFLFYIFPALIIYFFSRANFHDQKPSIFLRGVCLMALVVFSLGAIEFFTKYNPIYSARTSNLLYWDVFKGRRMMSTQIHPAALGTYFLAFLPLAYGLWRIEKKRSYRIIFAICACLFTLGVILTFSRGALLGLFIEAIIIIWITFRKKRGMVILALISMIFCLLIASSWLSRSGLRLFSRYSLRELSDPLTFLVKTDRAVVAQRMFREHPLLGVGLGHYRLAFDDFAYGLKGIKQVSYDAKVADCMFLTILAEMGLLGSVSFMLFVFFLLMQAVKSLNSQNEPSRKLILTCFLSAFLGMATTFLTYDALYWITPGYLFWAFAGILSSWQNKPAKVRAART